MASITIRHLDPPLEDKLRSRAAERHRSVEQEIEEILHRALAEDSTDRHWLDDIRREVEAAGGFELDLPLRVPVREPLDFS